MQNCGLSKTIWAWGKMNKAKCVPIWDAFQHNYSTVRQICIGLIVSLGIVQHNDKANDTKQDTYPPKQSFLCYSKDNTQQ